MDIVHAVRRYIERHQLLEPGARVVVGVSGGPDSVTLLHILYRLAIPYKLELYVAHLNHGIRGRDASDDMDFVINLAREWHLPITTEYIDVPDLAKREKIALEEAARRARYSFLCQVARKVESSRIAVGHNADDQAETVLMHLLRGTGLAGLRGMLPATQLREYHLAPILDQPPADTWLIRPLLGISRASIEAYCKEEGLLTRLDQSNLDTTYFRNKLRHEVLPYLATINPQISTRLRNLAEVVREDYRLLQEFVSVAYDSLLVASYSDALVFNLTGWREQPLAIQRAIVRRAAYQLCHSLRDIDFDHVEQAIEIAQRGETGAQATLPRNLTLTVGYTTLTIAMTGTHHLPSDRPWLATGQIIPVDVPGTTPLPGGWTLQAQVMTHWDTNAITENPDPLVAYIDSEKLGPIPLLRTRKRGDRFSPQGMGGAEVRLSDFLINVKVPRPWRDYLPLLEANGHILWITGIRLSEEALVHTESKRVIHLRFRGPKNP